MNRVYVVLEKVQYEGNSIVGVFSSRESAEKEAKAQDEALGEWGEDIWFEVVDFELMD